MSFYLVLTVVLEIFFVNPGGEGELYMVESDYL